MRKSLNYKERKIFKYPVISIPYLINNKINKVKYNSHMIAVPSISFFPLPTNSYHVQS